MQSTIQITIAKTQNEYKKQPISNGAKQVYITIKEQIRYQNSYICKIRKASAQRNKIKKKQKNTGYRAE